MNKMTKALVAATTITTLGLGSVALNHTEAHAASTPSATQAQFALEGNAGKDASYLTSSKFINGLNGGGLMFNGYYLTNHITTPDYHQLNVNDQVIQTVGNGKSTRSVSFNVSDNSVTLNSLKHAYGKDLGRVYHSGKQPEDGLYFYDKGRYEIQFNVENGHVANVLIGDPVTD
ncbi:hypothetical protein N9R04_10385 [Staphylococcus sp. SQ8-PEA]|uniref:Immunodominant staphylococcal antigen B n=1 Tax=Staphylococcus marylandisciuri TaxID=2981529 RepID=A0ABT2QSZ5_9STAP|nr:hypothetical protein [Staphylococcus marylandisciuri]MCU5747069.1 hypothetical protein [Staphylococcus marylandisciuri]